VVLILTLMTLIERPCIVVLEETAQGIRKTAVVGAAGAALAPATGGVCAGSVCSAWISSGASHGPIYDGPVSTPEYWVSRIWKVWEDGGQRVAAGWWNGRR
jgi:hypothetical protein